MRKRLKPKALDVGCMIEERKLAPSGDMPKSVPQQYVQFLRRAAANGTNYHNPPAGLSGIALSSLRSEGDDPSAPYDGAGGLSPAENPYSIEAGTSVILRGDTEHLMTEDGRFIWQPKMTEAVSQRILGEVHCLDSECCLVRFGSSAHWVPACCLNPSPVPDKAGRYALNDGGDTEGLVEGLLVSLHPYAKAVIAVSPFVWTPTLERAFNTQTDPGVVLRIKRGVDASCRVQIGGYLWSMPLSCLQLPPPPGNVIGNVANALAADKYLSAYQRACSKYNCRPNSALTDVFQSGCVSVLDISDNYLGGLGLKCLAEVLQVNSTITEVLLPHNSLSHDIVLTLIDALRTDRLIKKVDLSFNPLNALTGQELKDVLQTNTVIVDMLLVETNISDSLIAEINELALRNASA